MRAAEDGVQLIVSGGSDVDLQQQLFQAGQVFAGLFEEDLEELAQVDAGAVVAPWSHSCLHRAVPGHC